MKGTILCRTPDCLYPAAFCTFSIFPARAWAQIDRKLFAAAIEKCNNGNIERKIKRRKKTEKTKLKTL